MEKQVDRDEILAKSRAENTDEGMEDALSRGYWLGGVAAIVVFLIVYITDLIRGDNSYGAWAVMWAFLAASRFPIYRFTRNRTTLIAIIVEAFACLVCLISFLRGR